MFINSCWQTAGNVLRLIWYGAVALSVWSGQANAKDDRATVIDKEEQLKINLSTAMKIETDGFNNDEELAAAVRRNPSFSDGVGLIPGKGDHFHIMQFGTPVFVTEWPAPGRLTRLGMLIDNDGELEFLMMEGEQNFIEYLITSHQLDVQNAYYKDWLAKKGAKD